LGWILVQVTGVSKHIMMACEKNRLVVFSFNFNGKKPTLNLEIFMLG
jgi:hypothetical protein